MVSSSSASPGRLSTPTLTPAMPPSAARRASTRTRRRRPGPSVATSHTARVVSVSCRPEAVAPADAGLEGGTPLSGCQHATLLAVGSPDRSILASQASTGSTLVAAVTLVASTTTASCLTNSTPLPTAHTRRAHCSCAGRCSGTRRLNGRIAAKNGGPALQTPWAAGRLLLAAAGCDP